MDPTNTESPQWLKHADRMKAWHISPDKNKIRIDAKRVIRKRVGQIVEPSGFRPTDTDIGWELTKRFVTRSIYIQPSKYHDQCFINIAKVSKYQFMGTRDVKRLGHFYEAGYDRVGEPGALYYFDVSLYPRYVDRALEVLEKQAIPWLLK